MAILDVNGDGKVSKGEFVRHRHVWRIRSQCRRRLELSATQAVMALCIGSFLSTLDSTRKSSV